MTHATNTIAYDTLNKAANALRKGGYAEDLSLKPHGQECLTSKRQVLPEVFEVDAFNRSVKRKPGSDGSMPKKMNLSQKNGMTTEKRIIPY
ncbi:MAG: hypothetical protein RIG62_05200 [Cyclobacteriaceae bacterium]